MTTEEALALVATETQSCTKCDLCKGTRHAVPGEGSPQAEVMFIGEAPGYREDASGRPFVGPAGQFLNELLALIGLDRSTAFITNIVKHRPPDNRDPLPEEIAACADYLTSQIEALNPKVIVTLGSPALARFLPHARITQTHGQAKLINGRILVAMYNPAAALHREELLTTVKDDFRRALPAALAEARRLAAEGKLTLGADTPSTDDAPQQMTLF